MDGLVVEVGKMSKELQRFSGVWRGRERQGNLKVNVQRAMICSRAEYRRKQTGAPRTHDSAGEACPDKTQGRGGWVTENCGRQRLSQSRRRTGENTTKGRITKGRPKHNYYEGRTDVHPLG